MASIINAATSGGLVTSADTSGVLQLQTASTTAVTVDTSANVSVGTTTANTVAGNSNARYFAVQGDGTLSSADGRIVLSNPRAYASIVANTTTAGRVFFQLTNGSVGTITDAANIDAIATGSGGASGYGLDIRFVPKQDNGSSAEAARINFGGNLILKGGTTTANGTGITFPATQSASSNANTLDDYEEGFFTATFTPSTSGTITLSGSYNTLGYTKVGRVVTITGEIVVSSASSPVGTSVAIGGFPFAAGAGTASSTGFSVTDLGTSTARVGRINTTLTTADMFITASTIGTNSNFMFGFSYIV